MFEYSPVSLDETVDILRLHGANGALAKKLSKNHNDKNQVYSGSDFQPLHPYFDVNFLERTGSVSAKKGGKLAGKPILEANFVDARWLGSDGREVPARNLKMIIYPQYPESRLSGFDPVEGDMPLSLSVAFTKEHPEAVRYLVIARRGTGDALLMMVVNPGPAFVKEVEGLSSAPKSKVWKQIPVGVDASDELKGLLAGVVGKSHDGSRLDRLGNSIPFNGTQVCGFTLERALGIIPNSDKNGDYKGIELKTYTQKKVTLFTPEPDMGLYHQDFSGFMTAYGKRNDKGDYRLTGVHRHGVECVGTGLTLKISGYDPALSLAGQSGNEIVVGLYDKDEVLVAGWSLARMLNCWGAKHNEVVYIPASKQVHSDLGKLEEGYNFEISFDSRVNWCRQTSADKLLQAICKGTIFLDPAPKFVPSDPGRSKRRSQWRVNDIGSAISDLYDFVEVVDLA